MDVTRTDPAEVVAGLDRETKVRLLSGRDMWHTEAVPPAGIPGLLLSDGPHGVRKVVGEEGGMADVEAAPATCFPPAVTLGSTWDVDLLEEVGAALGAEARALGLHVLLGPGLNIKRHPGGGRNFEYVSEDPLLSGRLAAALVRGVQSRGVAACAKHYVANNQEHFRMRVDAVVDERTLREVYLRAFEVVVAEGDPWTIMSAYNKVNGEHVGESRRLLTDVLRGEWGFEGLVMSDWFATADRVRGVHAGMDLEMPGTKGTWDVEVHAALDAGTLAEADVDTAVGRLVALAQRVSHEPGGDPEDLHDAHDALARRAAAAGTVLLTNDGVLPLDLGADVGIVGALAAEPRRQGGGSSRVTPTRVDTLRDELAERLGGEVPYAAGYDPRTGASTVDQLAAAVRVAAACDLLVLVVGLPTLAESEGWDRDTLGLPGDLDRLVETLLAVNERTVVVLQHGAPVTLPWRDRPAALVTAGLGGQAGGAALADVLTGAVEPGGRLAESWPVAVGDLAADVEFAAAPTRTVHREGPYVGYRFHDTFDVAPAFAFGHGLGYTTWAWGDAQVSGEGTDLTIAVPLTNTGERRGAAVVQCYVHDPASTLHRPTQELRGFVRVEADPGETVEASITLDRRAFAVWDVAAAAWLVEAGEYELRLGASSRDVRSRVTVDVASDDVVTPVPAPAGAVATDAELAALLGRPVPAALPLLPFHRDSAVADLEETFAGRQAKRLLEAAQRRAAPMPDDESWVAMFEAVVQAAPLRFVAMNVGGPAALPWVDRVVTGLNRVRGG